MAPELTTHAKLARRVERLIERLGDGARDDQARDALLDEVLAWQAKHVPAYENFLRAYRRRGTLGWPAVPTDVFRYRRVASHGEDRDVRVFLTSGTSAGQRGAHALCDLGLYDLAARHAARYALFPDVTRMRLLILAPRPEAAPHASLSYMLGRFVEWFATRADYAWDEDGLLLDVLREALDRAQDAGEPIALLGTSFAFVHAEDRLDGQRWELAPTSRIMQTGGFKGRSRTVDADELRRALGARYGIRDAWIIQEYGMTELCSQLYEPTLREAALSMPAGARRLWHPGWVRCTVVDPDTLEPVPDQIRGLVRIDDLANLDSVAAIQTSDMAYRSGDGVVLVGRAADAVPRGCSIAVDEMLGDAGETAWTR